MIVIMRVIVIVIVIMCVRVLSWSRPVLEHPRLLHAEQQLGEDLAAHLNALSRRTEPQPFHIARAVRACEQHPLARADLHDVACLHVVQHHAALAVDEVKPREAALREARSLGRLQRRRVPVQTDR